MDAGADPKGSLQDYTLAGLETGTLATLAMIAWVGFSAMFYQRSFWTVPNLLASGFYGDKALGNRFTSHTFSGLALLMVVYGIAGILFGMAMQERRGALLSVVGVIEALAFYFVLFGWALKHWNPLIALYLHNRPVLAGHVLYGVMLGYYGRNLRKVIA